MDFLNKAPIAMHWLSSTGHVLWANETELNVLGYTAEEYIGQARAATPASSPPNATRCYDVFADHCIPGSFVGRVPSPPPL